MSSEVNFAIDLIGDPWHATTRSPLRRWAPMSRPTRCGGSVRKRPRGAGAREADGVGVDGEDGG